MKSLLFSLLMLMAFALPVSAQNIQLVEDDLVTVCQPQLIDNGELRSMSMDALICLGGAGPDASCQSLVALTTHNCPNGQSAGCATECGNCATGTGTRDDCVACCTTFHPRGPSRTSCIRHYC